MQTLMKMAPALAQKHRITLKQAEDILSSVRELVGEALAEGDDVVIADVGRLVVTKRRARAGRNPQNGKPLEIPARTTITFRPSSVVLDKLNKK